jgi:hypothetical protein
LITTLRTYIPQALARQARPTPERQTDGRALALALAFPGASDIEAAVEGRVALEIDGALTDAVTCTGAGATHTEAGNQGERLLNVLAL